MSKRVRVLIVDDSLHIRDAISELLARTGEFEICGQAENGKEATEKAQQLLPDLIVTDLIMPVMNGLEETRLLKRLLPSVPIIIYTSQCDSFVAKEAFAAGAAAIVSKSDAVSSLVRTARSLFQARVAA